jgi:hypothetical protein
MLEALPANRLSRDANPTEPRPEPVASGGLPRYSAGVSSGPDEDEDLLREAAEKAEFLAEQLMADAADLKAEHPEKAQALEDAAAAARQAAASVRDSDATNQATDE